VEDASKLGSTSSLQGTAGRDSGSSGARSGAFKTPPVHFPHSAIGDFSLSPGWLPWNRLRSPSRLFPRVKDPIRNNISKMAPNKCLLLLAKKIAFRGLPPLFIDGFVAPTSFRLLRNLLVVIDAFRPNLDCSLLAFVK